MAFGSPKGRRHRAKGWRRRKRWFGGLGARRPSGAGFGVRVEIERDIGAGAARQFRATACVSKRGRARRRGYFESRCGSGSGRSPTKAAKAALRSMAKNLR